MKHKSILITLSLLLTSCVGFQETDPEEFTAPDVTAHTAIVPENSLAVELSGSIYGGKTKIVKECGFYVSKNADMSDRTGIQSTVGEDFSAQFISKDFGTTFYYQAFISNGHYSVSSKPRTFEVKPFEYYVTVGKPEIISTDHTVIEVKSSVRWAEGVSLDEIGILYGSNRDFSGASEVQQISKFDVITKAIDLQPGIEYYLKAYAKSGTNILYSDVISVTTYDLPKVTTSEVTDVTNASATCGGVVESSGGASVTDYGVVYGTTHYLTINTASKKSAGKGVGDFSTTISNLASGTTYYVRAYATNSQGTAYGEAVSFSTCKAATGISLNKTSLTLTQGLTETLEATVTPTDAYDKMVLWSSSNNTVATVTSSGTVKGIKPGTATITATTKDGGYKATCNVTVTSNITGISLNKTSLTLSKGATETLVATITPSNADQSVTWTTDNANVATVSSTGKVTAIAPGTTTITATTKDGSKQATCSVTVTGKVTGVSLNKTSLTLTQGSSETLAVTVTPNDAVNKAVTWSSSNTNVVTVTSSGTVKGISPGSATITVTTQDGGYKATCSVTVKSNIVSVTGISLNKTSISLYEGSSETLVATVTPSNATNKTVTWSSSNTSVATVSSSGVVTAKAAGSTTITVTTSDGGKKATCTVTVKAQTISVTGVSLNKTSLSMIVGDTQTLTATITPSNATNKTVTWSSSNTSVATVSSSGVVTAKAAGSTTITVTTQDESYVANCYVTITEPSYIIFETISGENSVSYSLGPYYEYSYDGSNWDVWKAGHYLQFSKYQKLFVRGDNPHGISGGLDNASRFSFSNSSTVKCSGNIMSLLSYKERIDRVPSYCFKQLFNNCTQLVDAPDLPATVVNAYGYEYMFYGCSSLTSAPDLPATTLGIHCYEHMFCGCSSLTSASTLPAKTLVDYCYWGMFMNCTSLVTAPVLSAQTLAEGCCQDMFYGCTSLISAPALPATDLARSCYHSMFFGCTSLVNAPQLPATELAPSCYLGMFENCFSLYSAPNLPAISLSSECYLSMFSGCTSLQSAPVLPAIILPTKCYFGMFRDCSQLSFVKALFTSIGSDSISFWLTNVNSTGTFVKNTNAGWLDYGRIPSGWTVEYADE